MIDAPSTLEQMLGLSPEPAAPVVPPPLSTSTTSETPRLDALFSEPPSEPEPRPPLDATAPMRSPFFDDPPPAAKPAAPTWDQPEKIELPDSLFRDTPAPDLTPSDIVREEPGYSPVEDDWAPAPPDDDDPLGMSAIQRRQSPRPVTADDPWSTSAVGYGANESVFGSDEEREEPLPPSVGDAVIVGGRTPTEVAQKNAKRDRKTLKIVVTIIIGMVLIAVAAALFLLFL